MLKHCAMPQTFTNWRIPKRISGECEPARIGDHIGKAASEKPATNALLRQSTLPVIPLRNRRTEFTPKPQLSASDIRQTPLQLHRSKTTMDQPTTRSLDVGSPLKAQLGQWQQRLPDVDPNLLHKVLRLQDQQDAASSGKAARGALLPDARRTVERWMETASEPERQVAMRFFGSLAGGRLMGMDGEQNKRLKDVMDVLQGCCQSRYVAENGLSPRTFPDQQLGEGQDSPRLRHVRLLDEDTRRQRWMHTTWHHLPNYRLLNPVTNSSSHYVTPHKGQHRHFVIHPDWPPV